MRKLIIFLSKNYGIIFRVILFLLSILVVVYLFPSQGKFRYEFKKGSPWKHENLFAPFNFAIYKTDKELIDEKDSLNEEFRSYYKYDEMVAKNQLTELKMEFNSRWQEIANQDTFKTFRKSMAIKLNKSDFNNYLNHIIELLHFVFSKGIVESSDLINVGDNNNYSIMIIKNNIAEEYPSDQIFTLKTAYEYIIKNLSDLDNSKANYELEFARRMNIGEYLHPNLFYDDETTKKIKKTMLENLSITRGMVQQGERIIFKGEVVDEPRFQILQSLKREYESSLDSISSRNLFDIGQFMFIFTSFVILLLFILNFRPEILANTSKTLFILIIVVFYVALATSVLKSGNISIYMIPFVIVPITVKTFYDSRLALFTHLITILLVGSLAPNSFEFVFMQFIAGIVAIFSLQRLHRRAQLFTTAVIVVFTYSFVYTGILFTQISDVTEINTRDFAWFGANGLLLLLSYPLIYLFERIFGFISDVTLMEISDTNQPLLRKLAQEAPGTFQHSIQVANLAEEAVYHIGGNPLLVRTGALYHDIGKIAMPLYFIENQILNYNPHDSLEFEKSAEIIINHVSKGVELAHQYKLPMQVIDFIKTHHGTTKVQFFYRSYINKFPDLEIDVEKFTYPGPIPFTKETAVLMMADSVEAASRSLKVLTRQSLNDLVDNIMNNHLKEEQFNMANITFRDIATIRKIFKEKLQNIYHTRIEYPK